MVKVRANDFTGKGIVQKILFSSDEVVKGDKLVQISTMTGDVILEAPCTGHILKVAPPGSSVKSGSVVLTMEETEEVDNNAYRPLQNEQHYQSFEFGSKWKPIEDRDYSDEFSKASLVGDETVGVASSTSAYGNPAKTEGARVLEAHSYNETPSKVSNYNNSVTYNGGLAGSTVNNTERSAQEIISGIKDRLYNDEDKGNNGIAKDDRVLTTPMPSNSVFSNMRGEIANAVQASKQAYEAGNETKEELRTYNQEYRQATDQPKTPLYNAETPMNNFSQFRDKVNQRLTKLHDDNGYEKLDLSDADKQGAMDFLDEYGRPKTLRNIVTNRLAALRERNLADKNNGLSVDDDLSHEENSMPATESYEESGQMNSGYANFKKAPRLEEPSDYTNRVYSKLHDEARRENILRTQNQRELIKKRMEQIASGKIEADDVIGAVATYKRPSMEEMDQQMKDPDRIPDEIKSNNFNGRYGNNKNINGYRGAESVVAKQENEGFGLDANDDYAELKNQYNQPQVQQPIYHAPEVEPIQQTVIQPQALPVYQSPRPVNNDVYRELQLIQEKIEDQNKTQKHNELLSEIRKTKESSANVNGGETNFDKMMQMMMMQMMMNMNGSANNGNANMNSMMSNPMLAAQMMNNQMMPNPMMNSQMMPNSMMNSQMTQGQGINNPNLAMNNGNPHTAQAGAVNYNQESFANNSATRLGQDRNNVAQREAYSAQNASDANRATPLTINKFDNAGNVMQIKKPQVMNQMDNNINAIEGRETRESLKAARTPAVKSMMMAHNYIPPLTINAEVDMSEIIKMQLRLKNARSDMRIRFTTMSFIVKAISLCLTEYPKLNSLYDENNNQIVIKKSHHIGIATETSEGVIVPVVKFAEKLSLRQIATDLQEKTDRLKIGKLLDYELTGSTISIANYGAIGATQAVPTIMYPNSSMVSVGRIIRKPVVTKAEKIAVRSIMSIAVTIDQRIIDANEAGIFLTRLKELLEKPETMSM